MEAAPRLPMISFDLLSSPESVQFGKKLKPYIASFYNEDPEAYITEINNIEALRASAAHPSQEVSSVDLLKKYYCQLHFLKSRFPMEHGQPCFIEFEWRDCQNGTSSGGINFELMAIMYNIGALHSMLGCQDSRNTPEGMKSACSHFQNAAWAFQTVKEKYSDSLAYITSVEVPHFNKQVCLAQAQECILEKSMLDNRKSTIISKVAVQVWDYYRQALTSLKSISQGQDVLGYSKYKEWIKYLQFKIAYHRCIALLFQGQQAEELQKMGERVAFYQAACDNLEEARKYLSSKQQKELADALAFTADVVEGKKKAAKNENEYIYHEEVPDVANLQEVKGASLVKGIEFSVNDPEVSGPDIFARLVPMEAHEASSLYSEKKAQLLRNMGEKVEIKDQTLVEFMSSMQLDMLTKMHQATGIPQELIDRAAALSAKPTAIQDLIDSMAKLSNIYHDVEGNLSEIEALLKEEEENEKNYQEIMGKRPPSIITTDLAREASKYKEAHTKAKESNETLSKAMMTHLENLKILQRPVRELQQKLPSVELPDAHIDQNTLKELEMLNSKVDEMKTQRAMLWAQLRDAVHNDDITNALVTKPSNQSLDELFQKELDKHNQLVNLIEQNLGAQDNIKKAFVDSYAKAVNTRRYIQDIIQKRSSTIQALIASYDSYDDLLAKANKGIEFYTKLETNVSKLFQRIKSSIKVQQEEREQMLAKSVPSKDEVPPISSVSTGPKLKDYLEARKKTGSIPSYSTMNYGGISQNVQDTQNWPPGVRPAPLGSEITTDPTARLNNEAAAAYYQQMNQGYGQTAVPKQTYDSYSNYAQSQPTGTLKSGSSDVPTSMTDLTSRMNALLGKQDNSPVPISSQYNSQYSYSSYVPQNYTPSYTYQSQHYSDVPAVQSPTGAVDATKAATSTTNSYRTISSFMPKTPQSSSTLTHAQYPDNTGTGSQPTGYQYSGQPGGYNQSYVPQSNSQSNMSQQGPGVGQTSGQQNINQPPQSVGEYSYQYSQGLYLQSQNTGQYQQSQTAYQYPQAQTPAQYPQSQAPQQYLSSQGSHSSVHSQQTGYSSGYSQQYSNQTVPTSQSSGASSQPYSSTESQYSGPVSNVYGSGYQVQTSTSDQGIGSRSSDNQLHSTATVSQAYSSTYGTQQPHSILGASDQVTTNISGTYSQYQTPAAYQSTSGYSSQTNLDYMSQQHGGMTQQTYYPQGYSPNYNNPVNAQSQNTSEITQYPQQYYTQQHGSSVAQPGNNDAYYTYSAPTGDPYRIQSGTTNAAYMSTGVSHSTTVTTATPTSTSQTMSYNPYGSVYGYNQTNYAPTATPNPSNTYQTNTSQVSTVPQAAQAVTAKESNVDLLTGLDFSVSNIPTLTPQQNVPDKPKEPQSNPPGFDVKPPMSSPKVKEEPKDVPKVVPKREVVRILPTKPLNNSEVKLLFNQELEKYEKYVEILTSKTLSGPTTLDVKWKEIQDSQKLDNQKRIISVARCYPMKNRFPDILPYDYSRIELTSTGDDYINASLVKQVSPFAPQFIVTQAPLPSTNGDFWAMIREQQVELIFCLLNDNEISDNVYWPKDKGQNLTILNQNMVLSLQSVVVKPNWTERLISITMPEKKESWVVMHLQFTSWPGSLFPTTPEPFVSFVLELISLFQQQKSMGHPVVVHCSSGIGRSGLMCLLSSAILDVTNQASSIPDLAFMTSKLENFRKNILRDREHLKFAYEAMLCYMKQVLLQDSMKKKLSEVVPVKQEETRTIVPEVPETIIDPLSTLDPFWASKK